MESHEICEEIIAKYHGQPFGDEGTKLQIRYADTDEQKKLKNLTTERRQFKTHEYNAVVFGGTSPYQYPSPTSDGFPASFTSHVQGAWMTQPSVSPRYVVQSTIPSCTDFESQQYCKPKSVNGQRHADESCCTRIHGTCPRPVQSTRLVYCRQPKCDRCEQAHSPREVYAWKCGVDAGEEQHNRRRGPTKCSA